MIKGDPRAHSGPTWADHLSHLRAEVCFASPLSIPRIGGILFPVPWDFAFGMVEFPEHLSATLNLLDSLGLLGRC